MEVCKSHKRREVTERYPQILVLQRTTAPISSIVLKAFLVNTKGGRKERHKDMRKEEEKREK